jgi:basic amino acid/polyamine antiporter, APA family
MAQNFAAELLTKAMGSAGGELLSVAILLSIAGVICTNMLTIPRILFTMARERLFIAPAGRIHPRFKTPVSAILIPATIGIIMSQLASFQALLTYVVVFNYLFLGLTALAVIILRRTMPDLDRPYRVLGFPFLPLVFIGGILLVVTNEFLRPTPFTPLALVGVGITLLGIPLYFFFRTNRASGGEGAEPQQNYFLG